MGIPPISRGGRDSPKSAAPPKIPKKRAYFVALRPGPTGPDCADIPLAPVPRGIGKPVNDNKAFAKFYRPRTATRWKIFRARAKAPKEIAPFLYAPPLSPRQIFVARVDGAFRLAGIFFFRFCFRGKHFEGQIAYTHLCRLA